MDPTKRELDLAFLRVDVAYEQLCKARNGLSSKHIAYWEAEEIAARDALDAMLGVPSDTE